MPFLNRIEAGRRLAEALTEWRGEDPVVLALPRGGVPVAAEIAVAFHAPLDLVLVRKLGVPRQPELAMGAVVDGTEPITVRNEDVIAGARIAPADFEAVRARELAEIERRRRFYLGSRQPVRVEGRCAIVVDDGIATGATVRAALRAIRGRAPTQLVLATPVAPPDVLADLATVGIATRLGVLAQATDHRRRQRLVENGDRCSGEGGLIDHRTGTSGWTSSMA